MYDATRGIRAAASTCGEGEASVELTSDGGKTWAPVSFGDIAVAEVLAVDFVSETQINVVAKIGNDCSVTLMSSYTTGEFWQSYPDRLTEATYIDASNPDVLSVRGSVVAAPCVGVRQIQGLEAGAIASCERGVFEFDSESASWRTIDDGPVSALSSDSTGATVLVLHGADQECEGDSIDLFTVSEQGGAMPPVRSCAPVSIKAAATLANLGSNAWLWADSSFFASGDGGKTWTKVG